MNTSIEENRRTEDAITKILAMKQYVDHARVNVDESFQVTSKELTALAVFSGQDLFGAILLAFTYGRAKGYRAAADKAPRRKRSGRSPEPPPPPSGSADRTATVKGTA